MSILSQHPDLVETLASEYDVPLAVLQELLKREGAFGLAADDGCTMSLRSAGEARKEAATMAAAGPALRLVSLAAENLCPSSRNVDDAGKSRDVHLEAALSRLSLSDIIKLLLLGTKDADVRVVGFPPQRLSRHEYVLGAVGIWPGLLKPGSATGAAPARIRAEFDRDDIGFAIERTWSLIEADWIEEFQVHENGRCLAGRDASVWLNELIPPEMIPLFVFDTSDVLALMLSPLRRREALDRLYPRAFLGALASSVRDEDMLVSRNVAIRRLSFRPNSEITALRRRRSHAVHMLDQARDRIRQLESELAATGKERDRVRELSGMLGLRQPAYRGRGKQPIAIPEPLSRSGPGMVGISVSPRHRRDARDSETDRIAARLAELDAEMDDLRGRIEFARDDKDSWTEALESSSWKLRAYVAEEELAAASTPAKEEGCDPLARCLEDLARRLRRRSGDAVRTALRSKAALLDLPSGCSCELELDDEGVLHVEFGPRPSDGLGTFVEERAAFLFLRAMQEASGCSMPVFAVLNPGHIQERNRTWLRAQYVPLVSPGTIILAGNDCPGRP